MTVRHHEALAALEDAIEPLGNTENVMLLACANRIAAKDIVAKRLVPPADNSAVDGFAFAHADLKATAQTLGISMRLPAGISEVKDLPRGTAAQIFTGAPLPPGADTVAMQEDCRVSGETIQVPADIPKGMNCRKSGTDMQPGQPLLKSGRRIRPADIAALASQGIRSLEVAKAPRVAVFSTGDELIQPGTSQGMGQVFDSNRPMLNALSEHWPCRVEDAGRLPDSADTVDRALRQAATKADVIVTTGGASAGEEDHTARALAKLGSSIVSGIAIKPGHPLQIGRIGSCVVAALPGNPVAAFVCALLYLRPLLYQLSGAPFPQPKAVHLPAAFQIELKKPDRREFYRGIPKIENDVIVAVEKFSPDSSALISGLQAAGGLIEIPEETTKIERGELVRYLPFQEFDL